ncbi:6751_t:CDS:2 [Rhizophagus irregularis]|nr:6751_t:CDS:2 [Rhizophagus irregularis]
MSRDIGKLSQSMPPVKSGFWLWTDIYKQNPNDFLSKERPRDKCFICSNKYPEHSVTIPTAYDFFPFNFGQLEVIGSGGFSTVYLGIIPESRYWRQYQYNHVVLKSILKSNSNIITNLAKELEVNSKINEDFVPRYYGITQNPDNGQYMIVMQYVAYGDLRRYLQAPETFISWKHAIYLSRCIMESLYKIHDRGFIHKNFHTGNILIDHTKRPLISGLGFTSFIESDESYDNNILTENIKQFFICDEERYKFYSMEREKIEEHYSTHPQAIYKSRSMSYYISLIQSNQIGWNDELERKPFDNSLNSSKKRLYPNVEPESNEIDITQQIDGSHLSKRRLYSI